MERKQSGITNAGLGLFTKQRFSKNELVVIIQYPIEISLVNLDNLKYDDSAIYVTVNRKIKNRNRKVHIWITDKKNVKTQDWYYQNHSSSDANTLMKICKTENGKETIGWFAKRDIEIGEELLFNYNPGYNVKF